MGIRFTIDFWGLWVNCLKLLFNKLAFLLTELGIAVRTRKIYALFVFDIGARIKFQQLFFFQYLDC